MLELNVMTHLPKRFGRFILLGVRLLILWRDREHRVDQCHRAQSRADLQRALPRSAEARIHGEAAHAG